MNRKFIFVINPISGTGDKTSLKALISKKWEKEHIPYQFFFTLASGDFTSLVEIINNEKITDVIVCGGDGTINQVASVLSQTKVNIGIVPMGSGNGLAYAAGIPKNPSKALEIALHGKPKSIDGFYINGKFGCMLSGLGFDAQVAHDFAKQTIRGLPTYIQLSLKHFITSSPYHFIIHANNTRIDTDAFFISIANSNQFGNQVTIAPKASLNDGLLDIVLVNKMNKVQLLYSLLRQIRMGKVNPVDHKNQNLGVHYFQASELKIENPGGAPLHIDGEPVETAPILEIKVKPNMISLLQP